MNQELRGHSLQYEHPCYDGWPYISWTPLVYEYTHYNLLAGHLRTDVFYTWSTYPALPYSRPFVKSYNTLFV